jgi:hypothetical protein
LPPKDGGVTQRDLTERFNALVPRANKLVITWAADPFPQPNGSSMRFRLCWLTA